MRSSHQVWLIFYLACVSWQVCGCADNPTRSSRSRTIQTNAEAEPLITPLELGMTLIPAGEFLMGSESGEKDEQPVYRVFLDTYEIDLYIVTNEQYARFMEATDHPPPPPSHWNDRKFTQPRQPVVDVSWFDAVAYCKWAGKRLPTEAEWEKAARGGLTQKEYPWGDESPKGRADFGQKQSVPLPVGSFPPNGFSLYDCAGNVWEWCHDWYEPTYYAVSPIRNPTGLETGGARVLRGGAWNNKRIQIRVANRSWQRPKPNPPNSGFR